MILKFNSFVEQSKSNVIIEVLEDGLQLESLLERFDYYDQFKKVKVSDEFKRKLEDIDSDIKYYLKKINPFIGKAIGRNNNKLEVEYNIVPTDHFYLKFFRQDFEKREGYLKPGLFEGINLIYNNANEITRMILSKTISDGKHVLIRTKDDSMYSVIVIFNKVGDTWDLILKTQMKGLSYNDTKSYDRDHIIKLHPMGPVK